MSELDKSDIAKATLLKCLEACLGVVTTACKKAKVARSTYYLYLNEDSQFKAAVEDIQEQAIDFAESKLFKLISGHSLPEDKVFMVDVVRKVGDETVRTKEPVVVKGKKHFGPDTQATIFYLKTKGKKRGYVEKTEIAGDLKITSIPMEIVPCAVPIATNERDIKLDE